MQFGTVVTFSTSRAILQQFGVNQRSGVDNNLRLLQQPVTFEGNQLAIARTCANKPHATGIKNLRHGFLPSDRR